MNRLIRIIFLLFLSIFLSGSWNVDIVGSYSYFYELKIGDGRNDGVSRVYASTYSGYLTEWTYEDGEWTMIDCGHTTGGDTRIISLWLGAGRNDGLNRLYACSANGKVYEFSFTGGEWEQDTLLPSGEHFAGITVGNSRNDDVNRIIAGGWYNPCFEYSYESDEWVRIDVSSLDQYIWPMEIGQGRNDGIERIYCPDWINNRMIEYTWNGSSYDEEFIGAPSRMVKTIVGTGRNDEIIRVYSAGMFGHIQEFTYENGDWTCSDIQPSAPYLSRYGLCFGHPNPDGQLRLYSVAQGGAFREHAWNGSEWEDIQIDLVTGATASLTVGNGRNDGRERVYVAGSNGHLYEYTCLDTVNLAVVSGVVFSDNPEADLTQAVIEAGDFSTNANENGEYSLSLFEGSYTITATLTGYTNQAEFVELEPLEQITVDFYLEYLIPPTNLAFVEIGGNQVILYWLFDNQNDPDFMHFNVYRKVITSYWNEIMQTTENQAIVNIAPGYENRFYVAAEYVDGISDSSNVVVVYPTSIDNDVLGKPLIHISNYPNPFNPSTMILFSILGESKVEVTIYNTKGQRVKMFTNERYEKGNYSVTWNGTDDSGKPVSSGIYLARLKAGNQEISHKILLLK